ncbi:MAG: flagellar biosynthetic protein FliR [Nitrospinaceae bacterium]
MGLFELNPAEFEGFLFVLTRVTAFVLFAPILGSRQFPVIAKIGFVLMLSLTVFSGVEPGQLPQPKSLFGLSTFMILELLAGLAIAFATRLVFTAVQIGGTMVDFQMGFGVVNVIDPQTETQVSVTAQFQNIFALLMYLGLNAHHTTIHALVESFHIINPLRFEFAGASAGLLIKLFADTFIVAIKIAAPIMAILFFISVGLGLVARTVPQMNVFIVGFPLQIGAGLIMVGLSMSFFGIVIQNQIHKLPGWNLALLQTFTAP